MELSRITLELLRDEAYISVCREAILSQMEARHRGKASASGSHPLPSLPVTPHAPRSAAHFPENDPDIALYARQAQIVRLDAWVKQRLREELARHLEETNPSFQCGIRLLQALNEWEFCAQHVLSESLSEFARELRGLRLVADDYLRRGSGTLAQELAALRRLASRVEEQQLQLGRISAAVAGHAQRLNANDVLAPPLPNFRRTVWVDWLSVVPLDHLVSEVTRVEGDVRKFLDRGLAAALERLQASRNAGSARQELILQEYWKGLREHAQTHLVEERELDFVLDSLSFRYEAEMARREGSRTGPFVGS